MPHSGGDGPGSPISVERRQPGFERAGGSCTPPGAASRSRMGRPAGRACLGTVTPLRGGAEMPGQGEYLRARDIARLTGMSVRTARRWIAKRILASGKVGGARLIARSELERLLSPPIDLADLIQARCVLS